MLVAMAGDIEIPVHGVRKVIASNMVKSKQEIPHGLDDGRSRCNKSRPISQFH